MKFAVLADLHLTDRADTVKENVLDWALACIKAEQVDCIVSAGDLTAVGTVPAARRIMEKIRATGIPFIGTAGNAELRTPDQAEEVLKILSTPLTLKKDTVTLVMADSVNGSLTADAMELLKNIKKDGPLVCVTHVPPRSWWDDAKALWLEISGNFDLVIAGHTHLDEHGEKLEILRGQDPDKAIGGPPAVAFFEIAPDGTYKREDISFGDADPASWSTEERAEFLSFLGLSGMWTPLEDLAFALEHKVPCFELRAGCFSGEIEDAVKKWRTVCGKYLSVHLPSIGWKNGAVCGEEALRDTIRQSLACGSDRLTLHVPEIRLNDLKEAYLPVLEKTAECISEATEKGVRIGIENMHTQPGVPHSFGFTPQECQQWIDDLRERVSDPECIGFHFDIGHARNNAPHSSTEVISNWLAALGKEINGCHLHQVTLNNGKFENHKALTGLYDSLISLASFLTAWRQKKIAHAPLFLEIREGRGPESLLALRKYFTI